MKMYTDFPDYRQFVQTFFVDNRREEQLRLEQLRLEQAMAQDSATEGAQELDTEETPENPFEDVVVFPQLPGAPEIRGNIEGYS